MFHFTQYMCTAFAYMSEIINPPLPLDELTEICFKIPVHLSQIIIKRKAAF